MHSETTNPTSSTVIQTNPNLEEMSFDKILLASDNNSSKETIVYSSTSESTTLPTNINVSTTSNKKFTKGRRNKKKSLKESGNRIKNDHKVPVEAGVEELIDESNDEVFFDCGDFTKNRNMNISSPVPLPNKSGLSNGNRSLHKSLTSERESKYSATSKHLTTSVCVTNIEDKPKEIVEFQDEDERLIQKDKKCINKNKKRRSKKMSEDYSSTNIEEHVENNNSNKVIMTDISSVQILSNFSNDTVEIEEPKNRIKQKVSSNTSKKNHSQKKSKKISVSSPSIKSKSQRLSSTQDYFDFNEALVDSQTKESSKNSTKHRKERPSGEYSYNENDHCVTTDYKILCKERGPLPSWDEAAAYAENETEDSKDYMEVLENNFRNMSSYNASPLFDTTKSIEVTTTVISTKSRPSLPKLNLPIRPVTFSKSMETFKKSSNQPLSPLNYMSYPPPYSSSYHKNSFFESLMSTDQIKDCILRQIEYYLSEENLANDFFTRTKIDEKGYISLSLLASFPKIKKLTNDINLVIEAMKSSIILEMSEDCQYIRFKINYKR